MRSHTTAGAGHRPISHGSHARKAAPQKGKPCIWGCVWTTPDHEHYGEPRYTTNKSGICETCIERRKRQAAMTAVSRRIRRLQVGSWITGLDAIG